MIEHDMRLVMKISDRIIVLHHGSKIAEGPPQEIRQHPEGSELILGAGHLMMLKLHNCQCLWQHPRLQGVFYVKPKEIVTILGQWRWQDTLLMAIAGLVPPRHGEILWEGRPIQQLTPDQIKALGIGLSSRSTHLPEFTVLENLRMGPTCVVIGNTFKRIWSE